MWVLFDKLFLNHVSSEKRCPYIIVLRRVMYRIPGICNFIRSKTSSINDILKARSHWYSSADTVDEKSSSLETPWPARYPPLLME